MAEETQELEPQTGNEGGSGEAEAKALSPTEQEAVKYGWRPQEEFDGHPDDFVSAREFINRKSLFDRISRDKAKLDKLEATVQALVKHNEKVFEAGYQQAFQELQQQRDNAIREGDELSVRRAEDSMKQLQERAAEHNIGEEVKKIEQKPGMHPAWEPWLMQNRWYETNPEMHGAADGIARQIVADAKAKGEQPDYEKVLNEVARRVRSRFSEHFEAPRRESNVNRDDRDSANKGKTVLSRRLKEIESAMDDGERQIMRTILETTGMTKEKYLSDIEKTNRR